MVASPPKKPINAAPASERRITSAAIPTETAVEAASPPKNPVHVLLGENRGQSLGPFKALPTTKAAMSAAHVVANSIITQPRPWWVSRSQMMARQAGAM